MVHLLLRPLERSRRQATANNTQRHLQYSSEAFASVECKQTPTERSSSKSNHHRTIFTNEAPRQTAGGAREAKNEDNKGNSISSANVVTCGAVGAAHAPESVPSAPAPAQASASAPAWSSSNKRRQLSSALVFGLVQRATIMLLALITCSPGRTRASAGRMVRLCIASVEPAKLSSQCVMCNRREFPLTVIDCTGITKVNDLVANPLSVQEAACLIYNCRRQVPNIMPEPYHGAISHAARVNGHHYGGLSVSGGGMHNYQDSTAAMMQSPQLSSPTSTSMAMLSPGPISLANLFGGLPSPPPPPLFSPAAYSAAVQPSMAGYYAAANGFYPPTQHQPLYNGQQQQQQQQQTASSVPYSMRYGMPLGGASSGNYNVVPVQFVQQSSAPFGPLTAAVMGAASHSRQLSNLVHGRGSTMMPMSIAAWPQSFGGSNGFVYDAAATHPSMTAISSPSLVGPAPFGGQPSAMAMMISPPSQQQQQSPYSTMMMSSASAAPATLADQSNR